MGALNVVLLYRLIADSCMIRAVGFRPLSPNVLNFGTYLLALYNVITRERNMFLFDTMTSASKYIYIDLLELWHLSYKNSENLITEMEKWREIFYVDR